MGEFRLNDQTRNRLNRILTEAGPDGVGVLKRLREIRNLDGVPSFSAAMRLLSHVSVGEEDAERIFTELLRHRQDVGRKLGRDPGLQVAAIDYLCRVDRRLENPIVVEQSLLNRTARSAMTDELTGLQNWREFERTLHTEVRRARRHGEPLAVLSLDLDSFRSVNDLYGSPFGDLVLREAGRIVRRSVRVSDLASRIGGEELAVLLPETGRTEAMNLAERIRRAIEERFAARPVGGRAVAMTVSGGLAAYPHDGTTGPQLLAHAREALEFSKMHGRNRVTPYRGGRSSEEASDPEGWL